MNYYILLFIREYVVMIRMKMKIDDVKTQATVYVKTQATVYIRGVISISALRATIYF